MKFNYKKRSTQTLKITKHVNEVDDTVVNGNSELQTTLQLLIVDHRTVETVGTGTVDHDGCLHIIPGLKTKLFLGFEKNPLESRFMRH